MLLICISIIFAGANASVFIGSKAGASADILQEQSLLEPGISIQKEIGIGKTQSFRILLDAGQYLRILIEQYDVDATVNLFAPGHRRLVTMKNPYGRRGAVALAIETDAAGEYVVEVISSLNELTDGRYSIRAEDTRTPTPADRYRIKACSLISQGNSLLLRSDKGSWLQAVERYKEAITNWQLVEDQAEVARTLYQIGNAYLRIEDNDAATRFFDQARTISQQIADRRGEVYALRSLIFTYLYSDQSKARSYIDQVLPLSRDLDDKVNEVFIMNLIGGWHLNLGELRAALDYYNQVLEIRRTFKDWRGLIATLIALAVVYGDLSEWEKSIDHYEEALTAFRNLKEMTPQNLKMKATLLNNFGYTYALLGDLERATEHYQQALTILENLSEQRTQASTLTNIGYAEFLQGNYPQALEAYNRALTIQKEIGEKRGEAYTHFYKGYLNATTGNPQDALNEYLPALDTLRDQADPQGQASVLNKIGDASAMLARYDDARRAYDEALLLWQFLEDQRGQALTLAGMARLERKQGKLDKARINIEKSLNLFESLRTNVTSQQLRVSYFASVQDSYNFGIDLFMQMHKQQPSSGYDISALHLVEKARSRSLLETLAISGTDFRESTSPELLRTERGLQEKIEVKFQRQAAILQSAQNDSSKAQLAELKKELNSLLSGLTEVQEKIRFQSPRYAALTQPRPLTLKEIQQQVLDPETTLLEISLGEERSYLWLITQSEIKSFELPKRSVIEASAKEAYRLISTNKALFEDTLKAYWKEAANLSQMLLGQAAPYLTGKRLLIVSEGALQYAPFKALPLPGNSAVSSSRKSITRPVLLIEKFDVLTLPSASVMAVMRRQFAGRKKASKLVAVLADPVFSKEDKRFKEIAKNLPPRAPSNEQSSSEAPLPEPPPTVRSDLHRLEKSRVEAEGIASLVEPQNIMIKLDFQAKRENAKGDALNDYRIIHFATHGDIDSRQPDLSKIVLSLVDEEGKIQDGFLRLNDIYNLKLNADLVVLSACETALGKDVKGEGLLGLTRGFMYAGAARVVASLWKVDDTRTAMLMKRFYENMIKKNMEPSAALHAAQLEMWQGRDNSPYYWAAFVLQGEWRN